MDFAVARAKLVAQLRQEIRNKRVIEVIARVPRECFVPMEEQHMAYEDMPLPIGFDQTISQPYIVALMTEALEFYVLPSENLLAVGLASNPPSPRSVWPNIAVLFLILILSVPTALVAGSELLAEYGFVVVALIGVGADLFIIVLAFLLRSAPILLSFYGDRHWFFGVTDRKILLLPIRVAWQEMKGYSAGDLVSYPYQNIRSIAVRLRPLADRLSVCSADGQDLMLLFLKLANRFRHLIDMLMNLRLTNVEFIMGR